MSIDVAQRAEPDGSTLIVDDDASLARLLEFTLQGEGYRCTRAGSVTEAAQRLAAASYDVMVSDVRLPDGSGLDLVEEAIADHPEMAALVISGLDDIALADRALRIGAYGYVVSRRAFANIRGSGKVEVNSPSGIRMGFPYASTSRPASRIAPGTVICCPNTARIASSNPSHAPGARSPGRLATSGANRGSAARCAAMASGSAARSNMRRSRAMIAGRVDNFETRIVAHSAFPAAGRTDTMPCTPSNWNVRE